MPEKTAVLFQEKQAFQLGPAKFALATPPLVLVLVTCRQVLFHKPWNSPPVTDGDLIFLSVLTLAVFLRLITVQLVTELRPEQLSVAMKGFWRKHNVPTAEIRKATPVRYKALSEYGGYGVRSGAQGQAYIAFGDRAVQLELRDGSKFLVGSQRPEDLAKAIKYL